MNEEQNNKNIIQMLYYVIKTYDTGLSREDINSLDIMQQENTQLKQQLKDKDDKIENLAFSYSGEKLANELIMKKLKDKDEKISKIEDTLKLDDERVYKSTRYSQSYKDGYARCSSEVIEILETNKED